MRRLPGSRRLSAAEIATFEAWADAGAPAGVPTDAPLAAPPASDLGPPGATLNPGASYQVDPTVSDDYRCFLIDPGLSAARDPIGFQVHPGTPASVHHVLLFAVAQAQLAAAQEKDAAEPGMAGPASQGPGWDRGSTRRRRSAGGSRSGPASFPPGTGINLAAGTWIVMQVHYNLAAGREVSDRTTADLYYASGPVAKRARVLPLAKRDFVIAPGAVETVTAELAAPGAWQLWALPRTCIFTARSSR